MAASAPPRIFAVVLLLASTAAIANPRDIHGVAGGDTGAAIADPIAAAGGDATRLPVHQTKSAVLVAPKKATKTPPMVRGDDDDAGHTPRWHSFLPGMFR